MSPMRCPDCEKNVAIEIEEADITDYNFDGEGSVEITIHMAFACAECGTTLAEFDDVSTEEVPKLAEYLEDHEDVDLEGAELDAPDIETKIITRNGRKTYLAKWSTKLKVGRKTFKVDGEVAVTQDKMEKNS
jgi:hypothetical protein